MTAGLFSRIYERAVKRSPTRLSNLSSNDGPEFRHGIRGALGGVRLAPLAPWEDPQAVAKHERQSVAHRAAREKRLGTAEDQAAKKSAASKQAWAKRRAEGRAKPRWTAEGRANVVASNQRRTHRRSIAAHCATCTGGLGYTP